MTYYKTGKSGWVYETFPLDVSTSDDSNLKSIIDLWQSKRIGGDIPAWQDFGLHDFANRYGWFSVFDIVPGAEFHMRCRLWGTRLVELHGVDITGKNVFDEESGLYGDAEMLDQEDREFFHHLTTERMIGMSNGSIVWQNRTHVRYKVIMLPLADDNQNIDKYLSTCSLEEGSATHIS